MAKCAPVCGCGRHNRTAPSILPGTKLGQYKVKETKLCRSCYVEKDRSEFYARGGLFTSAGRPVLSSHCKECDRAKQRAYESDHADVKRAKNLMANYGITPEQYDEMLVRQDFGCAICGKQDNFGDRLCVDHCHETGVVRGLLCHACNRAIGLLGDNTNRLKKAIKYLEGGESDF